MDVTHDRSLYYSYMSNQPVTEPQKLAGGIFWVAAVNLAVPLVGLIALPTLTKNYMAKTYAV